MTGPPGCTFELVTEAWNSLQVGWRGGCSRYSQFYWRKVEKIIY